MSPSAFLMINSTFSPSIKPSSAMASMMPWRLLAFPDLTVDGSYTLGGAVAAVLIVAGVNPFLASLAAIGAGFCAGLVTGVLNTKLRIPALLAGILMMVGLYSINLRIMSGANVSLLREVTTFDMVADLLGLRSGSIVVSIILALVIAAVVFFILNWFLRTEIGLSLRATGDNEQMVRSLGGGYR
ncbi:hypothetical protein ES703_113750 [subsurface metagenome]